MSGFCPDCGNVICICDDVKLHHEIRNFRKMLREGTLKDNVMNRENRKFFIEGLKDVAILMSQNYDGNIQIQLDVNRANRICKIKITEIVG